MERRRPVHDAGDVILPPAWAEVEQPPAAGPSEVRAPAVRQASTYERFVKPAVDRCAGVALAVVALPIVLLVVLAIRVKLGKSVIYRQQRVGRDGEPFTMYKFRTMTHDRRKESVPYDGPDRRVCHKRDDDPRHTPLGRFLRRSSLDELPQLWNVVKGDMSLVGPRPHALSHDELFAAIEPD